MNRVMIFESGTIVTPTRRGAILALRYGPSAFTIRQISEHLGISKSTVHGICKHAEKKARGGDGGSKRDSEPPSLVELLAAAAPDKPSGRPRKHGVPPGDDNQPDAAAIPTAAATPDEMELLEPLPAETFK